jgi:sortase B
MDQIEGTPLDYPVMQNKDDNEYYLHRDFYGEYEYSGLPFLDLKCNFEQPSTNLIIYGHNMKSDAMFSCLTRYTDKEYFLEHPVIRFDTIYEEGEYEIIAVVLSQVYRKSDDVFKFYQFTQADTEAEFEDYIRNMKKLSLYDTGVDASFGDRLITLVTCNYHTKNGRLAVLAKRLTTE